MSIIYKLSTDKRCELQAIQVNANNIYDKMSEAIGNTMEHVHVKGLDENNITMFCDDEFLLNKKQELENVSIYLFYKNLPILGNVIFAGFDKGTGDSLPLTSEQITIIQKLIKKTTIAGIGIAYVE